MYRYIYIYSFSYTFADSNNIERNLQSPLLAVTLCKILAVYTIDGTWYCSLQVGLFGINLVHCGPNLGLVKGTFEELCNLNIAALPYFGLI